MRRENDGELLLLRFHERPQFFGGPLDDPGDGDDLLFELHFSVRDAGDVEQVVDHPRHLLRLPFDDAAGPFHFRVRRILESEDLDRLPYGGERIPQFMSKYGQKFVLAPVGFLEHLGVSAELGMGVLNVLPPFGFDLGQVFLAPLHVDDHAGRNGFVERQAYREDFAEPERAIERFFKEFEDRDAEDLIVADHFRKGPAVIPALLPVFGGRQKVLIGLATIRFLEALRQLLQQLDEVVQQNVVVGPFRIRLLDLGSLGPAVHYDADVGFKQRADFSMRLGSNFARISHGH